MYGRARVAPGHIIELSPGAAESLLRRGWLEAAGGSVLPAAPPAELEKPYGKRGRPPKSYYKDRMMSAAE
jgi:hypothetical protein